jgi:putative endonuclease
MQRNYFVYILANRSRTLYVGVTNDLTRRLYQHRFGGRSGFASRYAVHKLVHVEHASNPRDAIAREKQIKRWSRRKKVALIEATNPEWADLAASWLD